MAKNKTPPNEESLSSKEDVSLGEIEHRLTALEKSVNEVRKSHLEGHKWFTTVMFTLVGLLLVYTGNQSKTDVREAIRDMKADLHDSAQSLESKVDTATGEMEKRFAVLSGEALKKPMLEISTLHGPLDGASFGVSGNGLLPIYPLFLKNTGDKRTEPISAQLSFSDDILNGGAEWIRTATDDTNYPFCYYSSTVISSRTAGIGIAPQETWTLDDEFGQSLSFSRTNQVLCRFRIFYGADKPAEAKFLIVKH
jgi:hypothetical protein